MKKTRRTRRSRRGRKTSRRHRRGHKPQRGGDGSASLLTGYGSYPVTGKVPSEKIDDEDAVPTVMGLETYEELKEDL